MDSNLNTLSQTYANLFLLERIAVIRATERREIDAIIGEAAPNSGTGKTGVVVVVVVTIYVAYFKSPFVAS